MRVSIDSDDAGYKAFRRLSRGQHRVQAYLNGKRLAHCTTADTKLGCATVYETDESGNLVLNARGDSVKRKRLFGAIEIRAGRYEG